MSDVSIAKAMLTNHHGDLCLLYGHLFLPASFETSFRCKHVTDTECVMTLAPIEESIDDKHSIEAVHSIPSSELAELTAIGTIASATDEPLNDIPATEIINPRWVYFSASLAAASFLLFHLCEMNFCDPDMWHEMSLFRQTLIEGSVPIEDRFAYTPTVSPSIHHEWGAGAIFYAVLTTLGSPGIMVLKYSLVCCAVAACYWCATMRGASTAMFLCVAPAMALFSSYGFTTIRAQVFTLVLLAIMLCALELDQRGRRWWIWLWLPLHVLWLNVHAGFVVGSGLMALHACEQIIRRRPFWHFVPIGIALATLVFINPYGPQYIPYLMHGLTMARPLIVEWNPLWQHDTKIFTFYLMSLVPIAFAFRELGWHKMTGIIVLAASAYAAAKHTRHLSLYCVVWASYVPGYLQQTKFGPRVDDLFRKYGRLVTQLSVVITIICLCRSIPAAPWNLAIPRTNADAEQGLVCYPVDAVKYLQESNFRGNVMLPFEVGGYAMWMLHPNAKVSIDGRYEVAYQPGVLEDHLALFAAKSGWQQILTKYPTDVVIVPRRSRLSAAIPTMADWNRIHRDDTYDIYSRPGFALASNP